MWYVTTSELYLFKLKFTKQLNKGISITPCNGFVTKYRNYIPIRPTVLFFLIFQWRIFISSWSTNTWLASCKLRICQRYTTICSFLKTLGPRWRIWIYWKSHDRQQWIFLRSCCTGWRARYQAEYCREECKIYETRLGFLLHFLLHVYLLNDEI